MSNVHFGDLARDRFRTGLAEFSGKWGWYFALGIFLVALGFGASGMAVVTTLLSVVALGWILLVSGAALVISSFLTGKWSGFLVSLGAGLLSIAAGMALISYPISGAAAITVIIATLLLVAGIFRSIASVIMRFPFWGWTFVSGIVATALGVALLTNWPNTVLWFLGFAIGIDLIVHGISWMTFAIGLHRFARDLEPGEGVRRVA